MLLEHRNYAFINGLLLGLIYSCVTIFLYFLDVNMLFSGLFYPLFFWFFFLLFPIYVIRKSSIVLSTFKEIFSIVFLLFVVATFIYSSFTWVLYNLIDPSIINLYVDIMLENISNQPLNNYPQELNESLFIHNFSFRNQLNAYIFFLIPCVLYSFIISLIMKTT